MGGVNFLNLEYFLLLVYRIFTGTGASNIDISKIPTQTLHIMEYVAWAGLGLTALFAALFFYARSRMHHVEHAGWHKRHEQEEALKTKHEVHTPRNSRWDHVMALTGSTSESDWRRAITEADIMLGNMLEARGYRGATIGDKLKDANPIQFTTLDLAWKAHKVRNDIAHAGENFTLTEREARATIDMYRRVFDEFDFI
jgi:hypothetical protein